MDRIIEESMAVLEQRGRDAEDGGGNPNLSSPAISQAQKQKDLTRQAEEDEAFD
jgi:hypothetical protein